MNQPRSAATRMRVFCLILLTGCSPAQPFFLHEDGDLSHYLDVATEISYPDLDQAPLPDAIEAEQPLSTQNPQYRERWKLSLEEVLSIAMQNSQVIRTLNLADQQVGNTFAAVPTDLTLRTEAGGSTIWDPAVEETRPSAGSTLLRGSGRGLLSFQGPEAALAAFDAQYQSSLTWDRSDRPQNVDNDNGPLVLARLLEGDRMNYQSQITKLSAGGTQWSWRNITTYDSNNRPLRQLTSEWFTSFEAEVRHPLLRGSGVQINRIPIVLARIDTDLVLTEFEVQVRDLVRNVEAAYWNLYFYYHNLDAARTGFASAHALWKQTETRRIGGVEGGEAGNEAQARGQFYLFRSQLEQAQNQLFAAESQLRFLMGIAASDGRLIQPTDEPTKARVEFDWVDIKNEALVRRAELRRQKWLIKGRQLQLMQARNGLLPQFDAIALYRWLGLGDDLLRLGRRNGANFPETDSLAWDSLTEGRFQEWQLGFQFQMPLGYRQELAAVRNAQLLLRRSEKILETVELEVGHQLSAAVRDLQDRYRIAQTQFNRLVAFRDQVESVEAAYRIAQTVNLDLLLEAQRSLAQAEVEYFRAITEYNLAVMEVHYRKGSLLEYNGIVLAEGPSPQKAYFDAQTRARQRDASYYLNYGFSRPAVVSRGKMPQLLAGSAKALSPRGESLPGLDSNSNEAEMIVPENIPLPASEADPIYGTLGL